MTATALRCRKEYQITDNAQSKVLSTRTPMNKLLLLSIVVVLVIFGRNGFATQADDTTIDITGQTTGPTPFISQLALTASDTSLIKSIQFTVAPKPGSVTRPLSATYAREYLIDRGYLVPPSSEIFVPIY